MTRRAFVAIVVLGALLLAVAPASAATLDTKITSGPSGFLASRTAVFRFKSNVASAAFRCRLDSGAWSNCSSPKKYTSLAQGPHTFKVTAIKPGALDKTPAVRNFTVDTIKPETTLFAGPAGETTDTTPTFQFFSTEAGSFQCRFGSAAYTKCSSPYTPATPLTDGTYVFSVRARDKAGNVDPTPALRTFSIERVLTNDLASAQAAAAAYFPNDLVLDVEPACAPVLNNVTIECPGGVPKPPSDQLDIASTRQVALGPLSSYNVTVTSNVSTVLPVQVSYGSTNCVFGLTSGNGDAATWTVSLQLVYDGSVSPRFIPTGLDVTGVEIPDWAVTFWGPTPTICYLVPVFDSAFVADLYGQILQSYMDQIGVPLCAVPGPEYLGACP